MIIQIYPGLLKQPTYLMKFRMLLTVYLTNFIKQLKNLRSLVTDITMMEFQDVIYQ